MGSKDKDVPINMGGEHTRVCIAKAEVKVSEGAAYKVILFSPGLFEAVMQFPHPLDQNVSASRLVPHEFLHGDFFIFVELAIEICTIES